LMDRHPGRAQHDRYVEGDLVEGRQLAFLHANDELGQVTTVW
jgi:hypothetical protein